MKRQRGKTITERAPAVQHGYQGVPPEVWLQIFPHLLSASVQDVKNVTLTSKSFLFLAQPLLFQRICFHPSCTKSPTSGHLMSRQADSGRVTQRLEFFTSERIGHGVREVHVLPEISFGRREEGTVELGVIVDAIFRSLPRFPHLRALKCRRVVFSSGHLRQLHGLPSFEAFTALDCHIASPLAPADTSGPVGAVRDLEITWPSKGLDVGAAALTPSSHRYWLSLTHPDFLRRLTLFPSSSHLHLMLTDIVEIGARYGSLRSLKCSWYAVQSPYFVKALAQFPSLVELRLCVCDSASRREIVFDTPLADELIPDLTILEAPDWAIPLFIRNRPIRELSLATISELGSEPDDVIAVLDRLSAAADRLEKITVCVTKSSQELCDALAVRFPNLKSLTIHGNDLVWGRNPGGLGTQSIETVTAMFLSLQLPSSLEYLCLGNTLHPDTWDKLVDGEDVLVLKSYFLFNYPRLREAHFYSANIQLDWLDGKLFTATRPHRKFLDLQSSLISARKVPQQRRLSFPG